MAVPGDPLLVRQGVGAFELLHYFIDKSGTGVRYNYFLSGVYFVQSISHSISPGSFTTNITISNTTVGTGTNGYFICGSNYITFEGNNNTLTIDGVTNYPGFIKNGASASCRIPFSI